MSISARRTWLALFMVLAIISGVLMPPPKSAHAQEIIPITQGRVTWGIYESWRNYVGAQAATVSGGVEVLPSGEYSWPIESGTYDPESNTLKVKTKGQVRFTQYKMPDGTYQLDSTYKNVEVVISPTSQEIRLDYVGNSRSTGQLEEKSGTYATLNLSDVNPTTENNTTTWNRIPAFQASLIDLYPQGTPIDPVSIEYQGPGGKPSTSRPELPGGIPVLSPNQTWVSNTQDEQPFVTFASPKNDLLHVIEYSKITSEVPELTLRHIKASTMEEIASEPLPVSKSTSARFAYDPETESVFYGDFSLGANRSGLSNVDIKRAQYNPETKQTQVSTVATLTDDPDYRRIGSIVWDSHENELVVAIDTGTNNPKKIGFVYLDGEDWSETIAPLNLESRRIGEQQPFMLSPSMFTSESFQPMNIVPIGDGVYVAALGGTYQTAGSAKRKGMPAFLLERAGKQTFATPIAGTTPSKQALLGTAYSIAQRIDDKHVLLSTADLFYGDLQVVTVEDDEAEAGEEFTLPNWENTAAYAATFDPTSGFQYVLGRDKALYVLRDGAFVHRYQFPDTSNAGLSPQPTFPLTVTADGSVVFQVTDPETKNAGLRRFELLGTSPSFTASPASATINLGRDHEGSVTLNAEATKTDLASTRQWQVKRPNEGSFEDIAGETGDELTINVTAADNGTQFRAVERTARGDVVSDAATITVTGAPAVTQHPKDITVKAGDQAAFSASFASHPPATKVVWQRYSNGFWADISLDDDTTVETHDTTSVLTLSKITPDMNSVRVRAHAVNDAGDIFTAPATLTVKQTGSSGETPTQPEARSVKEAKMRWAFNDELQRRPPAGGVNYLSAGISDGTEATYSADNGDVSIKILNGDSVVSPSWETKADFLGTEKAQQVVELSGGHGSINPDGSATIVWKGSMSFNYYGGLAVFSITNPRLVTNADGTGELRGNLSGYETDRTALTKRPLQPRKDVQIATFKHVHIDGAGSITVSPEFAGREIEVPEGHRPQNRSVAGWGAWPQEFVDFQFETGLSSYWYSSGGSSDSAKVPHPVTFDFGTTADQDSTTPPPPAPEPPASNPSGSSDTPAWLGILGKTLVVLSSVISALSLVGMMLLNAYPDLRKYLPSIGPN